jgi:ABC-type uncharacterized transport system auxiliary subunit
MNISKSDVDNFAKALDEAFAKATTPAGVVR